MGWIGAISVSVVLNLLSYLKIIPLLAVNPLADAIVKGILFGFAIVIAKEVLPV